MKGSTVGVQREGETSNNPKLYSTVLVEGDKYAGMICTEIFLRDMQARHARSGAKLTKREDGKYQLEVRLPAVEQTAGKTVS